MLDYRFVDIDLAYVRKQMSDELEREVTDIEVNVWLRRCGFIQYDGRWLADSQGLSHLKEPSPESGPSATYS